MPLLRSIRFLLATAVAAAATAQNPPAGFTYQTLSDGQLQGATAMAFLPDGGLLITERATGNIRMFRDGQLQATPWATVAVGTASSFTEQGLLGIAVDPNYLVNRYVYVYYTEPSLNENRIGRLTESAGVGTNLTVLTPPGAILADWYHNGGTMTFGFDGTLFVASGDNYVGANAQSLANLMGKVLRYELPGMTAPANNPFAGSPIYSYGHRNMFGLGIHPVTGALYATENGLALQDEINLIVPGGNYGWPMVEGTEPTPNPALVDPLRTYSPTVAPTGMCFYTGDHYPASWKNVWFFTDYNAGRVRAVTLDATGTAVLGETTFHQLPGSGYGIQSGPDGNLWLLSNDLGGYGADELGRYVHSNESLPSAQLSAVSNKSLGGTVTGCVRSSNNDIVVPWLSLSRFPTPVATPLGNWWVPTDVVLAPMLVAADERVYFPFSLPNDRSFLGTTLHLQAISVFALPTLWLSNASELLLRG